MLSLRNAQNFARTRISATEQLKCRHFRSGCSRVDDNFETRRCYQRWSRSRAAAAYVRARRTCMHRMLSLRNARNLARTRISATKKLKCRHFRSGFSRVDVDFETRRCYQRWSRSRAENDKGVNILKTTFVGYTIAAAWIRARALCGGCKTKRLVAARQLRRVCAGARAHIRKTRSLACRNFRQTLTPQFRRRTHERVVFGAAKRFITQF